MSQPRMRHKLANGLINPKVMNNWSLVEKHISSAHKGELKLTFAGMRLLS